MTFVVVDLETTGGAPGSDSITEIGAVKVRGGEVLGEFHTLINPGTPIPAFITALTGITTALVLHKPRLANVLPTFLEFLGNDPDTVFVAHNARFDAGHLKAACLAHGYEWPRVRILDTVKLARRTFTKEEAPNVKLSTLARICNVDTQPTHRALDDAHATVDVLHTMLARLGPLGVTRIEDLVTATDSVPAARRRRSYLADDMPRTPGVYRFLAANGDVLYAGSSINVYSRVRQYFTAAEKRQRIAEMVDISARVEAASTPTELETRVLELREIEQFDPPYNRRSKNPWNRPWLHLTNEPHPRLIASTRMPLSGITEAVGPFSSRAKANAAASVVAQASGLRTCTRKLPAEPKPDATPCHLLELGKCSGPCVVRSEPGVTNPVDASAVNRARLILASHSTPVWKATTTHLAALADAERFEQAAEALVAANPAPKAPEFAGEATHIEETEILAQWLCASGTRLLHVEGDTPLALPRDAAARYMQSLVERPRDRI